MVIYGDTHSGNCYKLKLACALLSIPHEWVAIDVLKGESLTESFLAINPTGKIPALKTDEGEFLSESNAILYFLARDSDFWPGEKLAQTRVLQWQSFEQYSHEPYIAVARFIKHFQNMPQSRQAEYDALFKPGYRALKVMNKALQHSPFIAGETCTIADLSLYAYTHVAGEGGFDLDDYGQIQNWLKRIQSLPGYISMDD